MPSRTPSLTVPLPRGWTKIVRSATLHAISVAVTALTTAWGRAATGRSTRQRQGGEVDRVRTEIALLKEELEIKDARWGRVPARRRPHYDGRSIVRIEPNSFGGAKSRTCHGARPSLTWALDRQSSGTICTLVGLEKSGRSEQFPR